MTPCSPLIGRSCALDIAISTMADAGQNILVPRPGFPIYTTLSAGQVCLESESVPKFQNPL